MRFAGGPADGTVRELPAAPGGGPPRLWILNTRDGAPDLPGEDHLYELASERSPDGVSMMTFVRSDPVGMTE